MTHLKNTLVYVFVLVILLSYNPGTKKSEAPETDDKGSIEIYMAAEKPDGVPMENWLPINRGDEDLEILLRLYVPELEAEHLANSPRKEAVSKQC